MASCTICYRSSETLLNKQIIMVSHNHNCEKLNIIIMIMRNTSLIISYIASPIVDTYVHMYICMYVVHNCMHTRYCADKCYMYVHKYLLDDFLIEDSRGMADRSTYIPYACMY